MKVDYRKRFLKELSKIPSPIRQEIETFIFNDIPALNNFSQCNKRFIDIFHRLRNGVYLSRSDRPASDLCSVLHNGDEFEIRPKNV